MKYYKLIKPLLFQLKPETAHGVALKAMRFLNACRLSFLFKQTIADDPVEVMGLHFKNKIGLSAGFDKNGDYIEVLAKLGFGFVEVGTVTPKPQVGNPKPRLFRLKKSKALINRMGFNNKGVDHLVSNLKHFRRQKTDLILGVNIGKNAKTLMTDAAKDYLICMQKVYQYADYITANISSPNTENLRDLQSGDALTNLLATLKAAQHQLQMQYRKYVPLVVKVAPDLTSEQITYLAKTFLAYKIDAVIATNTALFREGCVDEKYKNEPGGLSGAPLFKPANQIIAQFKPLLGDRIPIIGVGGVMSKTDATEHLNAGACLVQVYTGLIYEGPSVLGYHLK